MVTLKGEFHVARGGGAGQGGIQGMRVQQAYITLNEQVCQSHLASFCVVTGAGAGAATLIVSL